jgi:hypothetical protein
MMGEPSALARGRACRAGFHRTVAAEEAPLAARCVHQPGRSQLARHAAHDLDLPFGQQRVLVVDRDRIFELNDEDTAYWR